MNLTSEIRPYLTWSIAPMVLVVFAHWIFAVSSTLSGPIVALILVGALVLATYWYYSLRKQGKWLSASTVVIWDIAGDTREVQLAQLDAMKEYYLSYLSRIPDGEMALAERLVVRDLIEEADRIAEILREEGRFSIRRLVRNAATHVLIAYSAIETSIGLWLDGLGQERKRRNSDNQ